MNAGLLRCCSMIPAMKVSLPSAMQSDVDLDRVRQIAVDEERPLVGHGELGRPVDVGAQPHHVAVEVDGVVHDLHAAAAEHVGGRIMTGKPIPSAIARAFFGLVAIPLLGWRNCSFSISFLNWSRSSARSIASGEVPRIGYLGVFQGLGELERASGRRTAR